MKSAYSQSYPATNRRTAMGYWRQPTQMHVIPASLPKFRFTKIVDTCTNIPGGRGYFSGFGVGQAAIDQGQVAFLGTGPDGQSGIYQTDPIDQNKLRVIANSDNMLPDNTRRFACFGSSPVFDQGQIIFLAQECTARLRIYRDTPHRLKAVVSTDTPLLKTGDCFINFSNPVAHSGVIAFMGRVAKGHHKGIFKIHQTPTQDLWVQTVVQTGEALSPLKDVSLPAIDGDENIAFRAQDQQGQMGIYRHHNQALQVIATTNKPIPDGSGCFKTFSDPLIDRGQIVFRGHGSVGQQGLYRFNQTGIETIVDGQTRIPGCLDTFAEFKSFALNGQDVAFLGCDSHGHTSLFLATPTSLMKVIELGNRLDDNTIVGLSFGRLGLANQSLVFRAQFVNGTEGIFRADFQEKRQ